MRSGVFIALAGRLRQLLLDLERVIQRAEHLVGKARETGDNGYLDGVALNLHSFYAGVESGFEDICRTVDVALPTGSNWHQRLLQQMTADIKDLRPAVVKPATRECLDEYRAFRHLVRNVYTFNLRPRRLAELADGLQECFTLLKEDLGAFIRFLEMLED